MSFSCEKKIEKCAFAIRGLARCISYLITTYKLPNKFPQSTGNLCSRQTHLPSSSKICKFLVVSYALSRRVLGESVIPKKYYITFVPCVGDALQSSQIRISYVLAPSIMAYCWLDPKEWVSAKILTKIQTFSWSKEPLSEKSSTTTGHICSVLSVKIMTCPRSRYDGAPCK